MAFTSVQQLREAIEKHPHAPSDHERKRIDLYRFLSGDMSESRVPTYSRPWRVLRNRIRSHSEPDTRLFLFFMDVYNAMCFRDVDDEAAERLERARAAGPARRRLDRLIDEAGPAVRVLRAAVPSDRLWQFDGIRVAEFPFEDPRGGENRWWIQFGDLASPTKLRPGGGRRRESSLSRQLLIRRFIHDFGLSASSAATVARDIFHWFLGQRIEPAAFRMWWRRKRVSA